MKRLIQILIVCLVGWKSSAIAQNCAAPMCKEEFPLRFEDSATVDFTYESGTGKIHADVSGDFGASDLPELDDVDSAFQADGYVISSNGGNYYGHLLRLPDLSDINTATQTDNFVLYSDGANYYGHYLDYLRGAVVTLNANNTALLYVKPSAYGTTSPHLDTAQDLYITPNGGDVVYTKALADLAKGFVFMPLQSDTVNYGGDTDTFTGFWAADGFNQFFGIVDNNNLNTNTSRFSFLRLDGQTGTNSYKTFVVYSDGLDGIPSTPGFDVRDGLRAYMEDVDGNVIWSVTKTGTEYLKQGLTINNYGMPPAKAAGANYLMVDDGAGNVSWVSPGTVGGTINLNDLGDVSASPTSDYILKGNGSSWASGYPTKITDGSSSLTVDTDGGNDVPGTLSSDGTDIEWEFSSPIVDILISNGGSGYSAGNVMEGSNVIGTYTVSGGVIDGVNLTDGRSGYTTTPSISPSDPGNGDAILTAVLSDTRYHSPSGEHHFGDSSAQYSFTRHEYDLFGLAGLFGAAIPSSGYQVQQGDAVNFVGVMDWTPFSSAVEPVMFGWGSGGAFGTFWEFWGQQVASDMNFPRFSIGDGAGSYMMAVDTLGDIWTGNLKFGQNFSASTYEGVLDTTDYGVWIISDSETEGGNANRNQVVTFNGTTSGSQDANGTLSWLGQEDGFVFADDVYVGTSGTDVGGTHNGGDGSLYAFVDTTKNFVSLGVLVGHHIYNITDNSKGIVTSISTTTNPNDTLNVSRGLSGGTDNDFDNNDKMTTLSGENLSVSGLLGVGTGAVTGSLFTSFRTIDDDEGGIAWVGINNLLNITNTSTPRTANTQGFTGAVATASGCTQDVTGNMMGGGTSATHAGTGTVALLMGNSVIWNFSGPGTVNVGSGYKVNSAITNASATVRDYYKAIHIVDPQIDQALTVNVPFWYGLDAMDPSHDEIDKVVAINIDGFSEGGTDSDGIGLDIGHHTANITTGIQLGARIGSDVQMHDNAALIFGFDEDAVNSGEATNPLDGDDMPYLIDKLQNWISDQWVGYTLTNVTDGSSCTILTNHHNIAECELTGGTDDDWDDEDQYTITVSDSPLLYYVEFDEDGDHDLQIHVDSADDEAVVFENTGAGDMTVRVDGSIYTNGDSGGLAGALGFTNTIETASGSATTLPTATSGNGPHNTVGDGWVRIYVDEGSGAVEAWMPYWKDS